MPHIRLDDKEIELSVGELGIGAGDGGGVRFDTGREAGTLAIVVVDARGSVTVRRATAHATVIVNGVALGDEPAPLLHGDRIEVAGRQLRFSDDRKAGSTVLMPALDARALADRSMPGTPRTAAPSGGRFVSLTDGREYPVPSRGLRIGRDASCDVVVPGHDVSRHHAEVTVGTAGYFVRDSSANGVFVNAARCGDAHLLRRGDVVRIGSEEFRFYCDVDIAASAPSGSGVRLRPHPTPSSALGGEAVRFGDVNVIFPPATRSSGGTARNAIGPRALLWVAAAAVIGAAIYFLTQDR